MEKNMNAKESIENALKSILAMYRGKVPDSLAEMTTVAHDIAKWDRLSGNAAAVLIAAARRDHFADDVPGWVGWCREVFDFAPEYRTHQYSIGKMLLTVLPINFGLYEMLFGTDGNKLQPLTRLQVCDLADFTAANNLEEMTRDEVRSAVNGWLGASSPESERAPLHVAVQPDLFDLVSSIAVLRPETVIKAIDNATKAAQACRSGLLLYGCCLEYYKTNLHTITSQNLAIFEEALLDDVNTIRAMRAAKPL
jgi:hypothetical protein